MTVPRRSTLMLGALSFCHFPLGCADRGSTEESRAIVLRVADGGGLGRFEPAPLMEGAAAAAIELTHVYARDHALMTSRSDVDLVLSPRPSSPLTARQIAAAVQFEGLTSVEVGKNDEVVVRFRDSAHRKAFEQWGMLDIGPFRIENPDARPIRLIRRGDSAVDVIEIVHTPPGEQWRLLHGRRLDVIPAATEPDRARLADIPRVRTVDVESNHVIALYFNLDNPIMSDVDMRRAIVRVLDRSAIAAATCGTDACRVDTVEPPAPLDVVLPPRLTLRVAWGSDRLRRAAEVVRHQLRAAGVDVQIDTMDSSMNDAFFESRATAMIVSPWSRTPESYAWFASPDTGGYAFTGYANPDYDHAVAAGDLETARRLLARDVPIVPLLQMRYFAVIDDRFCGDVHPTPTSWTWLADLRPCAPGESP